MSIPYLPLFVADYEADTAHLSVEEDGAYMRLLRLCWRTPGCSIPDDPVWIMRRLRVTREEFERAVQPVLDEFFDSAKGRLFSARLCDEHARIEATAKKRSAAGRKGGRPAKALKTGPNDESPAEANGKQPELEPELELIPPKPPRGGRGKNIVPFGVSEAVKRRLLPEDYPDEV